MNDRNCPFMSAWRLGFFLSPTCSAHGAHDELVGYATVDGFVLFSLPDFTHSTLADLLEKMIESNV